MLCSSAPGTSSSRGVMKTAVPATRIGGFSMAFAIWVGAGTFEGIRQLVFPTIPLPDADRIVMLHEGKLIVNGPPEEIKNSDNPVVRRFVVGEADERELAALR